MLIKIYLSYLISVDFRYLMRQKYIAKSVEIQKKNRRDRKNERQCIRKGRIYTRYNETDMA